MSEPISRRKVISRAAVGAAAVWATPSVSGFGITPVAAASAFGSCPIPTLSTFDGAQNFLFQGQLTAGANLTQSDASAFSNNTRGFVFQEAGPIQIGPAGYSSEGGFIAPGTWVCTLYLHASPRSRSRRYRTEISVPGSQIIGYDFSTAALETGDLIFGVQGVNYDGEARAFENTGTANSNNDYFAMTAPDTAVLRMQVGDCCVDHIRLFVTCLP